MGTSFKIKGMQIKQTPGVGAHLAKNAVEAAKSARMPNLSQKQMKGMNQKDIVKYNKMKSKVNTRVNRKAQRYGRKAAKLDQSLELRQAELAHGTIRQGLAELTGIGAEGVGSYAVTKASPSVNAIVQNTQGGIKEEDESEEQHEDTNTNGPIARGKYGRNER